MDVTAVVVVADRTEPVDALTEVNGVAMVALAVRALLATGLVDHVHLHDLGTRPTAIERACAGLPVVVEGAGRAPVTAEPHDGKRGTSPVGSALIRVEPGEVVLLHDAARPLAPAALGVAVVEALRARTDDQHGMAVPVLPLSDTVKSVDASGAVLTTPDRSGLRVLQTPVAARAGLLAADATDPLDHVRRHLARGGSVRTVPGDPAAFAVRSTWDLQLAELLTERTIAG